MTKAAILIVMKITCISDTHGKHDHLSLPAGDMLIHTGDLSHKGRKQEIKAFLTWFAEQPFRYKIFIAGNHDFFIEQSPNSFRRMIPSECIYLENSEILIEGIHIWGSPITPYFYNWAFNRHRGQDIARYWDEIPKGTDILITHGPPSMVLDRTYGGRYVGCDTLRETVLDINPQYHIFGHIHEGYGKKMLGYTQCINSSILNVFNKPMNTPQIIDYHHITRREKITRKPIGLPGMYDSYPQAGR